MIFVVRLDAERRELKVDFNMSDPKVKCVSDFLPGVPAHHVLERLSKSAGNEVSSGKLKSSESSAALAVNTFGWFWARPERLPCFSALPGLTWPPTMVEVEYCARFPWRGGRHPWLDALIETPTALIGVESKRFETFRDKKTASFSPAYDRPVWHDGMSGFENLRDRLNSGEECFEFLDAVQLVKHAFGLVTEGRRKQKQPHLLYLFAEPLHRAGRSIHADIKQRHRDEIARFAAAVAGAEVVFGAISYREWLNSWGFTDQELLDHRSAILARFQP